MGVPSEVEKRDAFVEIRLIGVLVALDLALATVLLLAPLVGHFLEEGRFHEPIELVDIHGVDAIVHRLGRARCSTTIDDDARFAGSQCCSANFATGKTQPQPCEGAGSHARSGEPIRA